MSEDAGKKGAAASGAVTEAGATEAGAADATQLARPQAYYQALFDALGEAYWAASTVEAKDQIQGARDEAFQILTAINQAQLDEDTTSLEALSETVDKTNEALQTLKEELGTMVKRISVAAELEGAIANVLALGGSWLA